MTVQARLLMIAPLLSALLSAVLWVLLSGSAARAALPDPTRPPPGLGNTPAPATAPLQLRSAVLTPEPAAYVRALRPAAPVVPPRVQGLQLHADAAPGSATALIDGRLLRVGDRLGDATVQDIRADGVWLRLPRGGTQWLGLYAPVEAPAPEPLTAIAPEQTAARKEP